MLDVADALEIVLQFIRPPAPTSEVVGFFTLGQTIAEDLAADIDSPPFTKALMDGYAIRAADSGPRIIVDELPAGMSQIGRAHV